MALFGFRGRLAGGAGSRRRCRQGRGAGGSAPFLLPRLGHTLLEFLHGLPDGARQFREFLGSKENENNNQTDYEVLGTNHGYPSFWEPKELNRLSLNAVPTHDGPRRSKQWVAANYRGRQTTCG